MSAAKASATYRADSTDAILSKIMTSLEQQDRRHALDLVATQDYRMGIKADLAASDAQRNIRLTNIQEALDKVAERVVVLEKDTWTRAGRAAAAVFVIGFLSWFVPWWFAPPHN